MQITRGIIVKAQKVVIYGPEGIGKSSFASDFPEPLFIDTEGSTNLMDVARLPRPTSWSMLLSQVREVKNTPGCGKTLVIDTIDWAEQMCVEFVCATHQKKGIEDFGYGNGYVFVKEEFGRLLNLLQDVIDIGINVVLTAHAQLRKFEQPDESGSYDRYELKLGKKTGSQTSPLVKEWADMVLFANYKTLVVTIDKKKKAQGGERVIYTVHHPSWDAKNRHDLAEELPLSYASIANCIPNDPQYATTTKSVMAAPPAKPEQQQIVPDAPQETANQVTAPARDMQPQAKLPEKIQPTEPKPPARKIEPEEQIPRALADLMTANTVTVAEIKQVVAAKGYYPLNTPITNYDLGFVEGVLIGAWEQVYAAIQMDREMPFK
jgi:hypothetical protein